MLACILPPRAHKFFGGKVMEKVTVATSLSWLKEDTLNSPQGTGEGCDRNAARRTFRRAASSIGT
eukprot:3773242-Rhodomonas_salina.1